MDGWVIVTFPDARNVYVDDVRCGKTNEAFSVPLGTHKFDLDVPANFNPPKIEVLIDGTPIKPTVVAFLPA